MPVSTKDIAWVAGILEGEGCFTLRSGRGTPLIQLMMTDMDIVIRVAQLLEANRVTECKTPTKSGKPIYRVNIFGRNAVAWCMTLYVLMGERRQSRIRELLMSWKKAKNNNYLRKRCSSRGGKDIWVNDKFVNVSA